MSEFSWILRLFAGVPRIVWWYVGKPPASDALELVPETQNRSVDLYVHIIFVSSACKGLVYYNGQGICRQNLDCDSALQLQNCVTLKTTSLGFIICKKDIISHPSELEWVHVLACVYHLSDKYERILWTQWCFMKVFRVTFLTVTTDRVSCESWGRSSKMMKRVRFKKVKKKLEARSSRI